MKKNFSEEIYQSSVSEHPALEKVPAEKVMAVIKKALEEISELEEIAYRTGDTVNFNRDEIEKISAIWVFSGPGNYDRPVTHPRYKDYSWTTGMDKDRVDYGILLAEKMTELPNKKHIPFPYFIYNGEKEQNNEVRKVIQKKEKNLPEFKSLIIDGDIHNTVDQTKIFRLPEDCPATNKEIALVSHSEHLVRIMHMINRYKPVPEKMTVRLFPVKTPEKARKAYALSEIRGLLYYIFLSKNHDATEESYAYKIHSYPKTK
jgi:hypothetical protein